MKKIKDIYKAIFFTGRTHAVVGLNILVLVLAYNFPVLYIAGVAMLWLTVLAVLADLVLLFANAKGVRAERQTHFKLSNGDENDVYISLHNFYSFVVETEIIDELPEQFQSRNFRVAYKLIAGEKKKFKYSLRPLSRGEYHFGNVNVLTRTSLGLVKRRIVSGSPLMLPCYPSFLKLRQYELLAISDRLTDLGVKKMRRAGNSTEFDTIKEYVSGNDVRTINWKATARKSSLMVNHYRDERAQQMYAVIDMGRIMKMPFEGLSLLDYSINAALVLSHVCYIRHDKPGLITYSNTVRGTVMADRKGNQLNRIQETLYNAKTDFLESNPEKLVAFVRTKVTQRSLFLYFTNFETLTALKRQMNYMKQIARNHVLVVILFENTELDQLLSTPAESTFDIYTQTIARKFDYEKRQVRLELLRAGIHCVYTKPSELTVNTLNKYLEIKSRGLI